MSEIGDDDYTAVQRRPDDPFNPPDPVDVLTRQRDTARRQRDEAEERERKLRKALAPVLAAFRDRAGAWARVREGHRYPDPDGTSDCANGCGCYMGPFTSGGPDDIDPFSPCPKASAAPDPRTISLTAEFDVEALRALLKED